MRMLLFSLASGYPFVYGLIIRSLSIFAYVSMVTGYVFFPIMSKIDSIKTLGSENCRLLMAHAYYNDKESEQFPVHMKIN